LISGHATKEGTERFAKNSASLDSNYKAFQGLTLSNVGVGTYLGDSNDKTDETVKDAIVQSVQNGINLIDTAINYRGQRAERSVGKAISELISKENVSRDELFVCTKNGYVTNDSEANQDFWEYVKENYVKRGLVKEGDISSGYHCMAIPYLEDQLEKSLQNLGLDCIDLLYIHNAVEGQIRDIAREEFIQKLYSVFELYERKRNEGKIKFYGMATWECFRVPEDNPQYLSIKDVVDLAKKAGGKEHGFRFVQLPYNMYYDQAMLLKNQRLDSEETSFLEAAKNLGIGVFTSVPFMQGRLLSPGVMPEFGDLKPSLRALQFIRSTPGVIAPLVGQKSPEHVSENLEIMNIPPMKKDEFESLVKRLTK